MEMLALPALRYELRSINPSPAPPPPYSLKCHHNGRGEDPGQDFDMGKGRSGTLRASAMSFMPHTTPT